MNHIQFHSLLRERVETRHDILISKGAAYSGNADVFDNFKRNAAYLGLTKYQVWLIYFHKHVDAIVNGIRQNPSNPVDKSEGMIGRIDDSTNYLDLLAGMLKEDADLTLPSIGPTRPDANS